MPALPWIVSDKKRAYFYTDEGKDWTPIGQNDAITWPDLQGVFARKDLPAVENYFNMLADHGVTCMRLMMEYCHTEHRYLEKPVGSFKDKMITLWDDLFLLAEKYAIRFLITPFDTFWMRRRWSAHPYNRKNGGPCPSKFQWLSSPDMRNAVKNRFAFFADRWGGSGALFAWDLWNEIHPVNARNEVKHLVNFIEDVGSFLKAYETEKFGKAHLQTVSFYGLSLLDDERIASLALRHPSLDFATIHLYDIPALDRPRNAEQAAIVTGEMTRKIISMINDSRPFLDSEHGPIITFNNRRRTLPEAFDNKYFHCMQWAHLASGGAGGGMRWPYRHPHSLTAGMRDYQLSLSRFCSLVKWDSMQRQSMNDSIQADGDKHVTVFSCGDASQCIIWLLRKRKSNAVVKLKTTFMARYHVVYWDTVQGRVLQESTIEMTNAGINVPAFEKDLAIYIARR